MPRKIATKDLLSKPACCIPVDCVHQVTVGVHGDGNAAVSHLALNVLRVLPLGNEKACVSVSQIVKTDSRKPGPSQGREEAPVKHVGCKFWGSCISRENEVKFTHRALELPTLQYRNQFGREVNLSFGSLRFRLVESPMVIGAADIYLTIPPVEIILFQAQEFALSRTGEDCRHKEGLIFFRCRCIE